MTIVCLYMDPCMHYDLHVYVCTSMHNNMDGWRCVQWKTRCSLKLASQLIQHNNYIVSIRTPCTLRTQVMQEQTHYKCSQLLCRMCMTMTVLVFLGCTWSVFIRASLCTHILHKPRKNKHKVYTQFEALSGP